MSQTISDVASTDSGELVQNLNALTQAEKHMRDHKLVSEGFNAVFKTGDFTKIVSFIKKFVTTYPLSRNLLIQMFTQLSDLGMFSLADEVALIHLTISEKLLEEGQGKLGIPPIFSLVTVSNQIQELVDQAALTNLMSKMGKLPQKPIFVLNDFQESKFVLAFSPYLSDPFEVIYGDEKCRAFQRSAIYAPYSPVFYKLSKTKYGHNRNFFYDSYLNNVKNNINPHSFTLKDITIDKAIRFLKSYGFKVDDDFVVVQLSDDQLGSGSNYCDSIKYLLAQGFKVFRVGGQSIKSPFECEGFIDLTQVERPAEVDIFLTGKAEFYFGSSSGLYSVAHNFGTPCCIAESVDYGGVRPNNFVQYLKLENQTDKSILSFYDIAALGLNASLSSKVINNRQLTPRVPSSQDNIKLVKEMLEYLGGGAIAKANTAVNSKRNQHKIFGALSSQALSLLT